MTKKTITKMYKWRQVKKNGMLFFCFIALEIILTKALLSPPQ